MFCSQNLMYYNNYYLKLSLLIGLPLGLLPVTSPSYTCFTNRPPFISSILSFHLHCCCFAISITASCPRDLTSSFLTLSSLVTTSTLLRSIISHNLVISCYVLNKLQKSLLSNIRSNNSTCDAFVNCEVHLVPRSLQRP